MTIMASYWCYTVWTVLIWMVGDGIGNDQKLEDAVAQRLLSRANVTFGSPYLESGNPVVVDVQIVIYSMDSFSEATMDYSMTIYLRQQWMDRRLSYMNESIRGPIELDQEDIKKVWVPDLYFVNEKKAEFHSVTMPNKLLHVRKDGTIIYSMRLSLKMMCNMHLQKYPLDTQVCPIVIESYGHSTEKLTFRWWDDGEHKHKYIELSKYLQPSHFIIDEAAMVKDNCTDDKYGTFGVYSCISVNVTLNREISYYIIQIYLPSILVVVLSWVSFWLHVEAAPARISLGVLTILTLTTQASGIRPTLPKVSYIKALDVWLAVCMAFVFTALLEFAVVNMITRGDSFPKDVKDTIKSFRNRTMRRRGEGETGELTDVAVEADPVHDNPLPNTQIKNGTLARAIALDNASRIGFPVVFFAFNVLYWFYYVYS